jgi:hypothetical protein
VRADAELRLVHRGRPVPRALAKTAYGLILLATAVLTPLLLWRPVPVLVIVALPLLVWLVDWAAVLITDGATDILSRVAWRHLHRTRAMLLSPSGIAYSGEFPGRFQVTVDWSDVVDTTFRRGPEGSWWFCLTATSFPLPIEAPTDRATRRVAENLLWFGTPFAINLALCHGVTAGGIDRAMRRWTAGRLRCRPPEPDWWRPPGLVPHRRTT